RATEVLAPCSARKWLNRKGIGQVREFAPGQSTTIGSVEVAATRARHDGRRTPLGPRGEPIGFWVRGSVSVYFAGDTDLFDEMEALRGGVDVALLPVWGWGARVGP